MKRMLNNFCKIPIKQNMNEEYAVLNLFLSRATNGVIALFSPHEVPLLNW